MQAAGQGPGGAAGGDVGHGAPGDSGGPGGAVGHEGAGGGDEGEAGAAAYGAPQVAPTLQAPGPGGNTVPGPGEQAPSEQSGQAGPAARGRPVEYCLTVPFPTAAAAEMVLRSMAPHDEEQQGAVRMQFRALGNVLSVRLTAEDPLKLEMCVNSCIDLFALSVWIMQHFMPPSYSTSNPQGGT